MNHSLILVLIVITLKLHTKFQSSYMYLQDYKNFNNLKLTPYKYTFIPR